MNEDKAAKCYDITNPLAKFGLVTVLLVSFIYVLLCVARWSWLFFVVGGIAVIIYAIAIMSHAQRRLYVSEHDLYLASVFRFSSLHVRLKDISRISVIRKPEGLGLRYLQIIGSRPAHSFVARVLCGSQCTVVIHVPGNAHDSSDFLDDIRRRLPDVVSD